MGRRKGVSGVKYSTNRDPSIIENPQKTSAKNIEAFIREKCIFYLGCETITEDAYRKYVRYCQDKGLEYTASFNVFARSLRYYLMGQHLIAGVGIRPVNYLAYKEGYGYVNKKGWAYTNLCINY